MLLRFLCDRSSQRCRLNYTSMSGFADSGCGQQSRPSPSALRKRGRGWSSSGANEGTARARFWSQDNGNATNSPRGNVPLRPGSFFEKTPPLKRKKSTRKSAALPPPPPPHPPSKRVERGQTSGDDGFRKGRNFWRDSIPESGSRTNMSGFGGNEAILRRNEPSSGWNESGFGRDESGIGTKEASIGRHDSSYSRNDSNFGQSGLYSIEDHRRRYSSHEPPAPPSGGFKGILRSVQTESSTLYILKI